MGQFYSPVIWIAHEKNLSGANYSLLEFIRVFKTENMEQLLVVNGEGTMKEAAERIGLQVEIIPFYGWSIKRNEKFYATFNIKKSLRNLFAVFHLAKFIRKNRAELVVTSTTTNNIGAWASFLTCRKHFWRISEFGEEDFGFKMPWGKWSYRFMSMTTDKVLVNSNALYEKYKKFIKDNNKIKVVYNPVIVEEYNRLVNTDRNDKEFNLLILGQINTGKNQLDAIKAIEKLKQKNSSKVFRLSIVGNVANEVYMKELQAFVQQHDLGDFVRFESFTSDIGSLMKNHDALLMCSNAEAFGRVTAEAMKYKLLVIGTNSGGTLDMILDHKTGLLYRAGDIEDLAEKIKYLSGFEKGQIEKMTQAAYNHIVSLTDVNKLKRTFLKNN